MAHYRATITSPTPAAEAFAYIADFANVAEWDPGVATAERLGGGPVTVGTAFDVVVRSAGRDLPFRYEVVAHDAPTHVAFHGTYRGMVSDDVVDVVPTSSGGSTVTYDADFRLTGLLRIVDPLLAIAFRRIGDRALAGLRTSLAAVGDAA